MATTCYSPAIPGNEGNHEWPVEFDWTDGYIGIVQPQDGRLDRVLLSPAQVKALVAFVKNRGREQRSSPDV